MQAECCKKGHFKINYLTQRQKQKRTYPMIDLNEFQLKNNQQISSEVAQTLKINEASAELCLTAFSLSSIHEPNILQIPDLLESFDLSENLLDRLQNNEKDNHLVQKTFSFQETEEEQRSRKKLERRMKNETKNIPKNFGKGIISFIEKSENKLRKFLKQKNVNFSEFMCFLKQEKRKVNTIADLRRLWTYEKYGCVIRVFSNLFFRRYSLEYIFNSRISNYGSHVKYRQTLWNALGNPAEFNHIKEY